MSRLLLWLGQYDKCAELPLPTPVEPNGYSSITRSASWSVPENGQLLWETPLAAPPQVPPDAHSMPVSFSTEVFDNNWPCLRLQSSTARGTLLEEKKQVNPKAANDLEREGHVPFVWEFTRTRMSLVWTGGSATSWLRNRAGFLLMSPSPPQSQKRRQLTAPKMTSL